MILSPDDEGIEQAARALRSGELVAFPTETVYGLGARADRSDSVRAIYAKKGRPSENPSIVHAASTEAAFSFAAFVPEIARALAARFWPGPMTMVLPVKAGSLAPEVTAFGPTVGLRVPSHLIARKLLERVALPIAAPSANVSMHVSPTLAEHVESDFGTALLVLDGGSTDRGIESTIIDASGSELRVLRRGSIGLRSIEEVAKWLSIEVVDRTTAIAKPGERAEAPGTMARHYAPTVPLAILDRAELASCPPEIGMLVRGAVEGLPTGRVTEVLPNDAAGYAREVYAALRRLERSGASEIWVERVPDDAEWAAVLDRLTRASRRDG